MLANCGASQILSDFPISSGNMPVFPDKSAHMLSARKLVDVAHSGRQDRVVCRANQLFSLYLHGWAKQVSGTRLTIKGYGY
jgi:hypothetical protein